MSGSIKSPLSQTNYSGTFYATSEYHGSSPDVTEIEVDEEVRRPLGFHHEIYQGRTNNLLTSDSSSQLSLSDVSRKGLQAQFFTSRETNDKIPFSTTLLDSNEATQISSKSSTPDPIRKMSFFGSLRTKKTSSLRNLSPNSSLLPSASRTSISSTSSDLRKRADSNESNEKIGQSTIYETARNKIFGLNESFVSSKSVLERLPQCELQGTMSRYSIFDRRQVERSSYQSIIDHYAERKILRIENDLITFLEDGKDMMLIKNENGFAKVMGGELTKILDVALLGRPVDDPVYNECLLLTYRHFLAPHELLIKLIERYRLISKIPKNLESNQLRIVKFLTNWVEIFWQDFDRDSNLKNGLEKFIDILRASKKITYLASDILNVLAQKKLKAQDERAAELSKEAQTLSLIAEAGTLEFSSLDPISIAEQLTKLDYEHLCKIKPCDIVEHLWTKGAKVPSVDHWIARFNVISYWVATEICTASQMKNRIAVVENMIKVLKALRQLNNFSSMMAVIAGLNMSAVSRLKKTWNGVHVKMVTSLNEIENIMDPKMNYQNYRDLEVKLKNQPFIPFLGLYLKDMTFANDGNPKLLPNGMINFGKSWTIYEIMDKIRIYQDMVVKYPEDARVYEFCSKLNSLEEKKIYNYSLMCEPRAPTK